MKNKLLIYKIILVILLIAMIIIIGLIARKYSIRQEYEEKNSEIVQIFDQAEEKVDENGFSLIEFEGYKVIRYDKDT
jgi:cell division protein FtsL